MILAALNPLKRCGAAPLRAWRTRRCGGAVDCTLLGASLLILLWGLANAIHLFFV